MGRACAGSELCCEFWVVGDCCGEVRCGPGGVGAGCELLGVGGVLGDEGAGCVEDVRAGAEAEEGAGEEEESEEPGSRPGRDRVGISDRDEFRPANSC